MFSYMYICFHCFLPIDIEKNSVENADWLRWRETKKKEVYESEKEIENCEINKKPLIKTFENSVNKSIEYKSIDRD